MRQLKSVNIKGFASYDINAHVWWYSVYVFTQTATHSVFFHLFV